MITARIALGLSIATVTITMALLCRYGQERMFLIYLGRRMNQVDVAVARSIRLAIVGCGLLALFYIMTGPPERAATSVLVTSIIQIGAMGLGTLRAVVTSRLSSPAQRYAVPLDTPFRAKDLASPFWQTVNLCLFAVAIAIFISLKDRLPAEIPLQFGWDGSVRRKGPPGELWISAYFMVFHTMLMLGLLIALSRERTALSTVTPEDHLALHRTRRLLLARLLEVVLVGSNAIIATTWITLTLHGLPEPRISAPAAMLIVGIGTAAVAVGPLLYFIRLLIRVQDQLRMVGGSNVLGTHADGWIFFGSVYYAPDDPAVFVPKRHGIGQTLNFARPTAWLLLVAIVAVPVLILWIRP
ncbi:MAG: DUF5808 domain-containing protein [Myxococcota bacterium]